MTRLEKIVFVTRKTALEELVLKFNTRENARFYLEALGHDFGDIERAHETFGAARQQVENAVPSGVRSQWIAREDLPNFVFGARDLVVALGQDGLVVNAAKYLDGQILLGLNPDPSRIEGTLLAGDAGLAPIVFGAMKNGHLPRTRALAMACVETSDGQKLEAVNDLFFGQKSHVSARYTIAFDGQSEAQISSGVLVSTGAGSTGWWRSIRLGAHKLARPDAEIDDDEFDFGLETRRLGFVVREAIHSRLHRPAILVGEFEEGQTLELVSQMPEGGVIFSDGVESDFLEWREGVSARVGLSPRVVNLMV